MSEFSPDNLITMINSNILSFSIAVAVIVPFAIILVGYGIHMLCMLLAHITDIFVSSRFIYVTINYLFFPGVVLHELSHALFAVLTGAKVTKIVFFKKEGDTLGHVEFRHRGNSLLIAIQRIFISSAPMFLGTLIVWGCYHTIFQVRTSPVWLKFLLGYIGISMLFHMTMSKQDVKVYLKGVPVFSCLLFVVTFILKLFARS